MNEVRQTIERAVKELFGVDAAADLSRPAEKFGDFATNIAMQLVPTLSKNPRQTAEAIKSKLDDYAYYKAVEVAGPGFLNITLKDQDILLMSSQATTLPRPFKGQSVVAEYSDPNPFKILHAGHLYTSIVGDAIANLYAAAGADVHRVNFGGDVGLHVAKTIWAMLKELAGLNPEKLQEIDLAQRSQWLAECYVTGNNTYENDEIAKAEIIELNKKIYEIQDRGDKDSPLAQIYWTTRGWSYDYFDQFYDRLGTKFEKYYPESQTVGPGLAAVQSHPEIFIESEGAVIFKGEDYGLHTRVFINSQGLPTYETKDVGLMLCKWQDYRYDQSIIITGSEQMQYLAVVLKAVEQFEPEPANRTKHITHGMVKLKGGAKMSSRLGNILRAVDILDAAAEANREAKGSDDRRVVLGAVKYSLLKPRIGADIIYEPEESVSLAGNSGPYLQYAYARAASILAKGTKAPEASDLEPVERSLARKISEYPEVVTLATQEMLPHHICTYLYELAQTFNRFYENNRVIGDGREAARLKLVESYSQVLASGLNLLGIEAPERI